MRLDEGIFINKWFIWSMFILGCLLTITMIGGLIGIPLLVLILISQRKQILRYEKLMTPELQDMLEVQRKIEKLNIETQNIVNRNEVLRNQEISLSNSVAQKKNELIVMEEELLMQEFGLYKPLYDFADSDGYKDRLKSIREQQKTMVKNKVAISGANNWTVNGKRSEGKKMINQTTKVLLRAFNNECESSINKVKFNNFDTSMKRIDKSFEQINTCGVTMQIRISPQYLALKKQELHLAYEYAQKREEEKEALRQQRAEIREQEKLEKELKKEREKLEKERTHFRNALASYEEQLKVAKEEFKADIIAKINEIKEKLGELQLVEESLDYREHNNRAGYVYIISNLGAFGEDVYKIGVTRRLEPLDRVKELGDASVPFEFDVHAMIFTDDAFGLEKRLHSTFDSKRLNKVNTRREFFKIKLEEIERIVRENHNKTVEFKQIAEAEQYRISLKM